MTGLPDRLRTVLAERFTELGNPFSAMRRHEQGPDGWPASHPVGPHQVAEVLRELLATDQAVLPAPAERTAVLREAAGAFERDGRYVAQYFGHQVAAELRRMADEAQQPRCTCGRTACESDRCDCDSTPCPVNHAAEAQQAEGRSAPLCAELKPWLLLAGEPDAPPSTSERVRGGRRLGAVDEAQEPKEAGQ